MGIWDWLFDWVRFEGSNDLIANEKWVIGSSQHTQTKHLLKVTPQDTYSYVTIERKRVDDQVTTPIKCFSGNDGYTDFGMIWLLLIAVETFESDNDKFMIQRSRELL